MIIIMSCRSRLLAGVFGLWLFVVPAFTDPGITLGGATSPIKTLILTNLSSTNFSVEASQDLRTWFRVGSGPAFGGMGVLKTTNLPTWASLFFRGREGSTASMRALPQIETNLSAVAALSPQEGGFCSLTNANGVIFSFLALPGDVVEPVAIRMSLVTNFATFPATNALRAAVAFEPEGYKFAGAPSLEIQFPTNISSTSISSFSFAGDGGRFSLVPDRVFTNKVRIPILHFSGGGTASWTPEQRADLARQVIDAYEDATSYKMALELAKAREKSSAGGDNDPLDAQVAESLLAGMDEYFRQAIEPFIEQAKKDCALARVVAPRVFQHLRHMELLGLPTDSVYGAVFGLLESAECVCVKEALEKCQNNQIQIDELMKTLLGLERQSELLGMGSALAKCGAGGVWQLIDDVANLPCAPHWVGTASYSDVSSRSTNYTIGTIDYERDLQADLKYDAVAVAAEVINTFPPLGQVTWRITFNAQAAGSFKAYNKTVSPTACSKSTKDDWQQASGSGSMKIYANLTFTYDKLTAFTMDSGSAPRLDLRWRTRDTIPSCIPGGQPLILNAQGASTVFLSPHHPDLKKMTFTSSSLVAIEGTGVRDDPTGGIDGAHTVAQFRIYLVARPGN